MRNITKGVEPPSLAQHRLTPQADYGNLSPADKDTLRQCLVTEQRGLCSYCMQSIRPRPRLDEDRALALPGELPRRATGLLESSRLLHGRRRAAGLD